MSNRTLALEKAYILSGFSSYHNGGRGYGFSVGCKLLEATESYTLDFNTHSDKGLHTCIHVVRGDGIMYPNACLGTFSF